MNTPTWMLLLDVEIRRDWGTTHPTYVFADGKIELSDRGNHNSVTRFYVARGRKLGLETYYQTERHLREDLVKALQKIQDTVNVTPKP